MANGKNCSLVPLSREEDDLLMRSSKKIKHGSKGDVIQEAWPKLGSGKSEASHSTPSFADILKGKDRDGDSSDDEIEAESGHDLEDRIDHCPKRKKENELRREAESSIQDSVEKGSNLNEPESIKDVWRTVHKPLRQRKNKDAKQGQPEKKQGPPENIQGPSTSKAQGSRFGALSDVLEETDIDPANSSVRVGVTLDGTKLGIVSDPVVDAMQDSDPPVPEAQIPLNTPIDPGDDSNPLGLDPDKLDPIMAEHSLGLEGLVDCEIDAMDDLSMVPESQLAKGL
ncbi:hypothetical protein K1719_046205 [Acacia pycnantha]|nr:hypothetical protein K1719_046205 [Acacia pycnantha]